ALSRCSRPWATSASKKSRALRSWMAQPQCSRIQTAAGQRVEDAKLNRAHERLRRPEAHRGLHDTIVCNLLVHPAPPFRDLRAVWAKKAPFIDSTRPHLTSAASHHNAR